MGAEPDGDAYQEIVASTLERIGQDVANYDVLDEQVRYLRVLADPILAENPDLSEEWEELGEVVDETRLGHETTNEQLRLLVRAFWRADVLSAPADGAAAPRE
jgi:hypothetical protein